MSLKDLAPLLREARSSDFYSLQKGPTADQARVPGSELGLIDFTPDLRTFAHTAAMISHLDLVISVDTAVAHLAGAMGKPVWLLLPFVPDWRWMLNRDDTPWYPTMRLFRQTRIGRWVEPLGNVIRDLRSLDGGLNGSVSDSSPARKLT